MNQYQQLIQYINSNGLPFRGNCIECGGNNTLSAAIVDGFVLFHCYRASCPIRGKYKYDLDLDSIRNLSNNSGMATSLLSRMEDSRVSGQQEYIIPNHFTSPLQNLKCFNFLKRWNLLDIYAEGRVSIWHDPKLDRCVFGVRDYEGLLKGATGRLLGYNKDYPKWFVYQRINSCPGIIINRHITDRAILVEDFISACMASNISSGVALCGTGINTEGISFLRAFKILYIALDPDATGKAIKLQHQLSPYIDTKIIPLEKDIKYYSSQDLEILKRQLD